MIKLFNAHSCQEELKDLDLKITPARVGVMKFLENTQSPVDVSSIVEYLKDSNINVDPATVFRIVNLFVSKGVIQRIELGEGKYRYEKSDQDHHHLICTNCGRVEDVEDKNMKEFEKEIRVKKGFLVKHHSLEFFGLCRNCQN